ncbi:MAG: hypothetical protein AMS27_01465 [Bacteroides sp. SM23_62_1]|nr:MAG: hypothetical protein AMS27_01465 [Bacteroides sp. SM23_62_1]
MKDEIPPRVVKENPVNYSVEFDQDRIEIEFDEFIQLMNINQELMISPPMKEKPLVRIRKKSILIDLDEQLYDSTTYTLNFGQAIVDNNEGNPLENYEFVFSTGTYIDSLGVSGIILNAFNLQPSKEPIYIMLYDVDSDSVPYLEIPLYVGRASSEGSFYIHNIRPDTFKVFALKDINSNFLYDNKDEMIAFMDTTFILSAELIDKFLDSIQINNDTLTLDSLNITGNDTLMADSQDTLAITPKRDYSLFFDLYFFQEDFIPQYLSDFQRTDPRKIEFYFNRPLKDTLKIEPLNFAPDTNWYIHENFVMGDTLFYWIKDSSIYNLDSLQLHLNYLVTDSAFNYVPFDDTVYMVYKQEVSRRRGMRREDEQEELKEEILGLSLNVRKGARHDIYKKIKITPDHPISFIDQTKIQLFFREDTNELPRDFKMIYDPRYLRNYCLEHTWEEGMNYRLFIEPGAFTDIYGMVNDTIDLSFNIQSLDHYSKIILMMEDVHQQTIIQLLDDNERLIAEKIQDQDGSIEFPFLEPVKYKIKVIFDENRNGKWDTGRYLDKIQPEKVKYYSGTIELRANWDLELTWSLENK